jgi:hypothetical protein
MATLIDHSGAETEICPESGEAFGLKELQKAVGGYIELVYLGNDKILVVNEEGLLENLPLNRKASTLARRPIVGNVVYCDNKQID